MKPCHKKYAVIVEGHSKGAVLVKLHQQIVIQIGVTKSYKSQTQLRKFSLGTSEDATCFLSSIQ